MNASPETQAAPTRDDDERHHRPHGHDHDHGRDRDKERDRERQEEEQRRKAEKDREARERWRQFASEHKRPWSSWLLIRYTSTDLGFRPIPTNTAFWCSPDIWIESSDLSGNAVAGEPNFVHARVFNLGKADAVPTRVDFYWADPSLGLGPSTMNLIGHEWTEIPAHTAKDVRCSTPWVPVFLNGGHECLMVNSHAPINDPMTAPFQPKLDRHVGQRNVTVLPGPKQAQMQVVFNNLASWETEFTLVMRSAQLQVPEELLKTLSGRELVGHLAAFQNGGEPLAALHRLYREGSPQAQMVARSMGLVRHVITQQRGEPALTVVDRKEAGRAEAEVLERTKGREPERPAAMIGDLLKGSDVLTSPRWEPQEGDHPVLRGFTMEPFEQARIELRLAVPEATQEGEFAVFHFQQIAMGMLVGGYTIVVPLTES
jgi:hypothetical protein